MYGPCEVAWQLRSGERESYKCWCIKDARDLWDKLNATGITMISNRP